MTKTKLPNSQSNGTESLTYQHKWITKLFKITSVLVLLYMIVIPTTTFVLPLKPKSNMIVFITTGGILTLYFFWCGWISNDLKSLPKWIIIKFIIILSLGFMSHILVGLHMLYYSPNDFGLTPLI